MSFLLWKGGKTLKNLKDVNPTTIARTLFLGIALLNQLLSVFGWSPINLAVDEGALTNALSVIFTVVAGVWAWWKNNSFTREAKQADELLQEKKILKSLNK